MIRSILLLVCLTALSYDSFSQFFVDPSSGKVGIGTVTPSQTLDINGTLRLSSLSQNDLLNKVLSVDTDGVVFWKDATSLVNGTWSLTGNSGTVESTHFIGTTDNMPFNIRVNNQKAGRIDVNGATFIGYQAGNNYSATNNGTFTGYQAGFNTIAERNTGIGYQALLTNNSGRDNTAIGHNADVSGPSFSNSTAIGSGAIANGSNIVQLGNSQVMQVFAGTGTNATLIAGRFQMTGGSPGVGKVLTSDATGLATWTTLSNGWSLSGNTNASNTNFIGTTDATALNIKVGNIKAGRVEPYNSSAAGGPYRLLGNSSFGYQALSSNNGGAYNTSNGYQALSGNTMGNYNAAVGYQSQNSNTTGSNNTSFGSLALATNTTGSNNTAIGYAAGIPAGSLISNATAIGANAQVTVTNGIVLGTATSFVGIRQNSPAYPLQVQNAYCDGNSWYTVSDKNLKENFTRIAGDESVLSKVMSLPIQYWNYKTSAGVRHIGPTAQDFYEAFKLGNNEKAIASVDEAGVALAAIQELNLKMEQLEKLVKAQQQLIASLATSKVEEKTPTQKNDSGLELYQNTPNPFRADTEIRMTIPDKVQNAYLYVYDLQGKPMKTIQVTGRGAVSIKLEGGILSAGMYLYALVADSQVTDVKKMILTSN